MIDSERTVQNLPKSLKTCQQLTRSRGGRSPLTAGAIALATVMAASLLLLPTGASAASDRSACSRYGDVGPAKTTRKHARQAVTCFINRARRNNGRGGLNTNAKLVEAARRHSNRMANTGCFAHQCSGESSTGKRLARTGYFRGAQSWAYGENIAWGKRQHGTPRKIVKGWMHSSGHRAIILSRTYREIGVGFAKTKSGRGYYTADLAMATG